MSKFWSEAASRCEPYIPGEQLNQPGIIKLNTNENPFPPSPTVIEAIQQEAKGQLNLYPPPAVESLREELAAYYQLNMENIFVGNGSDEVLALSFMAFFDPGKVIRFPDLTYSFYPVYAKLFDIPYETIKLNDDFTIHPEGFFASEGGVIFANPNAPTSIYLELDAIEQILINNPNQIVIVDEAYIDFAKESALGLLQHYPNLLVIQTLSKSRSLAGLRVGFAFGSKELIEGLNRVKNSFNSYTIDRLAIAGARAAIKDHPYFVKTRDMIVETREWTRKQLQERGFEILPSQTNFLFIRHAVLHAEDLYLNLKEKNILVRYFNQEIIEDYLRVTIGTEESMQQFLNVLDKLMKQKQVFSAK